MYIKQKLIMTNFPVLIPLSLSLSLSLSLAVYNIEVNYTISFKRSSTNTADNVQTRQNAASLHNYN